MKQSVGIVGWRGMVGSVLMQRMREEGDFSYINPVFFSTSNAGGAAPTWAEGAGPLQDAYDIETLKKLPIILTAQGGDYTSKVYPELRNAGWEQAKPIVIGDNVWVGGNVVILGGVTIGDNVVIGAGSVVTKDIPPNSLAVGNPCKVLREISAQDRDYYQRTFIR